MCPIHFVFHLISNKLEQIYHGESGQFPKETRINIYGQVNSLIANQIH
jgi:hypothetical protein